MTVPGNAGSDKRHLMRMMRPSRTRVVEQIREIKKAPGPRTRRSHVSLVPALFGLLSLVVLVFPVAAHSMAGGVDHVNGIDDLWPVHATLMTAGISSMLVAVGIVHFGRGKNRWWFRVHPVIALAGAGLAIAAIGVAVTMVSNSLQPHLQYFHGWFGALTIVVIIVAPILMIFRKPIAKRMGRPPNLFHRAAGFTAAGLMAANILLGLSMMHVI